MRLVVTDITQMGPKLYCLAGWDLNNKNMVRPLPNGKNWSRDVIDKNNVQVGSIIHVQSTGTHKANFPHLTEDVEINASNIKLEKDRFTDWLGDDGPEGFSDLNAAFSGNIKYNKEFKGCKQGVYVPINTQCKSLIGMNIPTRSLEFFPNNFDVKKLKVRLKDESSHYEMSVSSHRLKSIYRQGGIEAINSITAGADYVHVRIGLARAWEDNPEKCFAMLNEVHC